MMIAALIVTQLLIVGMYAFSEHRNAPWLPWWRRYLSVLFLVLQMPAPFVGIGFPLFAIIAIAVFQWNTITAENNRRNGKNHKKLEAEARQTEVEARVWARECAEAQ